MRRHIMYIEKNIIPNSQSQKSKEWLISKVERKRQNKFDGILFLKKKLLKWVKETKSLKLIE